MRGLPIIAALVVVLVACRPETPEEYCRPHPAGTVGCRYGRDQVLQPGCRFPDSLLRWPRGPFAGQSWYCVTHDGDPQIDCRF